MRGAWSLLVFCALTAHGPGQEGFQRSYEAAEDLRRGGKATAAAVREAYRLAYTAFARIPPSAPEYRSLLARGAASAYRAGEALRAVRLLEEAWNSGQQDAQVLELRLLGLYAAGEKTGAMRLARQQVERLPEAVGRWLLDAEQFSGLCGYASRLLQRDPGLQELGLWIFEAQARAAGGDPNLLANLGLARRQLGLEAKAEEAYRAALQAGPELAWLHNDYGLFLKGCGRREEAELAFQNSRRLEKVAGEGPGGTNLAVLALRGPKLQGGGAAALGVLQPVLAQRPDSVLARRLLLDILSQAEVGGKPQGS